MITELEAKEHAKRISSKLSVLSIVISVVSISAYAINIFAYKTGFYGLPVALILSPLISLWIFGVVHEAMHFSFFPANKKINDFVGKIFTLLLNMDFESLRNVHNQHHSYANSKKDPDLMYDEQGKYIYLLSVPTLHLMLRIFVVFPKYIRNKITKKLKNKIKIFVYLYQKDKKQCRLYRFNFLITLISVLIFGFDSILFFCYISAILSIYVIYPVTIWIPHLSNFDREIESVDKYKTSRMFNLAFKSILLFPAGDHQVHHLFPQVQVTRLNKFSKYIQPLIIENRKS